MATINKKLTVLKVWDGTLPAYKIEPGPYSLVSFFFLFVILLLPIFKHVFLIGSVEYTRSC